MKLIASIPFMLCAAVAICQTQIHDNTGGYGPDSVFNKSFNVADTFTFNGKVTAKSSAPPLKGMAKGISLTVKQGSDIYNVQMGPEWFVGKIPLNIRIGDMVTVQGSRSSLNGKKIVYAELVTKGKKTIALRSKTGWGRWNAMEPNVTAPEKPNYSGTISSITHQNYNGVNYDVYNLQTGLGNVSILGAPSWYSQHQPQTMQIGNNVQVVGSGRIIPIGNNTFVADGFYSNGTYIVANPWFY